MNLARLKQVLKEEGIHLNKNRGQNFLIDDNITVSLISKLTSDKNDQILEIGTGFGALTEKLLNISSKVVSYENDKKVFKQAAKIFHNRKNLILLHEDFLKSDFLFHFQEKFRVISNMPYSISSQILIKLWYNKIHIKDMYLLMQKEVGIRLLAETNSGDTGFLSILYNLEFDVKIITKVKSKVFFPEPKVDSVYVEFKPKNFSLDEDERKAFFLFVKSGFEQKRKQLFSRWKKKYKNTKMLLKELKLPEKARPQELSAQQWYALFKKLKV